MRTLLRAIDQHYGWYLVVTGLTVWVATAGFLVGVQGWALSASVVIVANLVWTCWNILNTIVTTLR